MLEAWGAFTSICLVGVRRVLLTIRTIVLSRAMEQQEGIVGSRQFDTQDGTTISQSFN